MSKNKNTEKDIIADEADETITDSEIIDSSSDESENNNGGAEMATERVSFDSLVRDYGVDKSIARGLKAKLKLQADGLVKEDDFIKALKEFTNQTPRG